MAVLESVDKITCKSLSVDPSRTAHTVTVPNSSLVLYEVFPSRTVTTVERNRILSITQLSSNMLMAKQSKSYSHRL